MKKTKNGFSYELNGWLYVSVNGEPRERGYAYGFLIAEEMKKVKNMLDFLIFNDYGRKWEYFIEASIHLYNDKIKELYPEFYEEMKGVAEGCTAGGTKTTLDEIIAWNNYFALTENWYSNKSGQNKNPGGEGGGQQDRCSAFIANGDWTSDGKIIVSHNNFSNFIDGQFARIVLDMKPTKGARMLIQGFPGWIWSGTDFFVTSYGIIGTETTIGGFLPFENNLPISCRIRSAMQYGKNLDDYSKYLKDGNSGDYANTWYFGDTNSNEIMRIELGLKYVNEKRTKNGYFIGFNAPYDPQIRCLECTNTGIDDIRRHQGSRRVRLEQLLNEYKGKIDVEIAKKIISDHYDVYLNKIVLCSRTVCSHYELDGREFMSDPSRPKPYQPRGAVDGNICDTTLAKKMSFVLRYGNSCGTPFYKDKFCNENMQWNYLRPYLLDRPQQPWTQFSISNNNNKKTKYNSTFPVKSSKTKSKSLKKT